LPASAWLGAMGTCEPGRRRMVSNIDHRHRPSCAQIDPSKVS
jgi:hypothetical protein